MDDTGSGSRSSRMHTSRSIPSRLPLTPPLALTRPLPTTLSPPAPLTPPLALSLPIPPTLSLPAPPTLTPRPSIQPIGHIPGSERYSTTIGTDDDDDDDDDVDDDKEVVDDEVESAGASFFNCSIATALRSLRKICNEHTESDSNNHSRGTKSLGGGTFSQAVGFLEPGVAGMGCKGWFNPNYACAIKT